MTHFIKDTIPIPGDLAYYNGQQYEVILTANQTVAESKRDKFPLTVVYKPIDSDKIYSLPYWYFNKFYSYCKIL